MSIISPSLRHLINAAPATPAIIECFLVCLCTSAKKSCERPNGSTAAACTVSGEVDNDTSVEAYLSLQDRDFALALNSLS